MAGKRPKPGGLLYETGWFLGGSLWFALSPGGPRMAHRGVWGTSQGPPEPEAWASQGPPEPGAWALGLGLVILARRAKICRDKLDPCG